jgi:hypothetical protein
MKRRTYLPVEKTAAVRQRAVADRAGRKKERGSTVGFASVAQRYEIEEPAGISEDTALETQQIGWDPSGFGASYEQSRTTFSGGLPLTETTSVFGDRKTTAVSDSAPKLKISENRRMAVHHTEAQPKEFFAEPSLVQESNDKLETAGASVFLEIEGSGVRVKGNGNELVRTVPGKKQGNSWTEGLERIAGLAFDDCNEVINLVLGSTGRALVFLKNGDSRRQVESERNRFGEPTGKTRDYLSDHPLTADPSGLRDHLADTNPERDPLKYQKEDEGPGRYLEMDPGLKKKQAENLGLNEFARPETGEGFVISSAYPKDILDKRHGIPTGDYIKAIAELKNVDKGKDVSQQFISTEAKSLMDSWFVHYASVMARDGDDCVTLENYNRIPERDWAIRKIFNKLLLDFGEFREYVTNTSEQLALMNDSEQAMELVNKLYDEVLAEKQQVSHNLRDALALAKTSFDTELKQNDGYMKSLLFFQMYGPGKQSFHSAYEGSTFDPITTRLRNSWRIDQQGAERRMDRLSADVRQLFGKQKWNLHLCDVFIDGVLQVQVHGRIREAAKMVEGATGMNDLELRKKDARAHINDGCHFAKRDEIYFINTALQQITGAPNFKEARNVHEALDNIEIMKGVCDLEKNHSVKISLAKEFGIPDPEKINKEDLVALGKLLVKVSNKLDQFNFS